MSQFFDDVYEVLAGRTLLPFYETFLRGRPTFRYRDELEANQWRSPEEIRLLQWEKLRALLHHAYDTSPYYREAFDGAGLRPDAITTPETFARLPILDKATVRAQQDRLLSSAFEPRTLIRSATGGSTGEPMPFCFNQDSYRRRTAAAMRGDGWAGWRYCGPEFYIWGIPLLPQSGFLRLKKQFHHACLRRVIVSSFDLSPEKIEGFVATYNRQQPRVVIGYANPLYEFARSAKKAGYRLHRPIGVISSAEKLYDHQRTLIEEVFQAPVFDRYGCREVMMIAAECDRHAGMHVTADNLYVEIVRDGRLCAAGERGEILLTDLHNYGMPLIRYKVGDVGSWKEGACPCGRGLPLLNVVEGRTLDLIRAPSGRIIAGEFFHMLFKDFEVIRRFQVVQEEVDALLIRLSLNAPVPNEQQQLLMETMAETVGREMRVDWEIGEDVVIDTGAKYRQVISRVPADLSAPTTV